MLNIFRKEPATQPIPKSNIKDLINDGNDYFSDELICLGENLTGNLFCAEKVIIDQHAELTGNITSKTCLVTGVVNGNITSLDLLDIKAGAVVRGSIQSATVNIEPGAVINGYITVGEDIEALNEQWKKTKFATDEYLTMKLQRELASLNKITTAADPAAGKIEPGLVAAVIQQTANKPAEPLKAAQTKPLMAAGPTSLEQPKQELTAAKPVLAAATSAQHVQQDNTTVAAPKPLVAAAPQPKTQEQENNSRWW